jgi:ERCC4-type nuclease
MQHHDEVDVDKAVQAGSDDMTILGDASGDNDVDREDIRATAQDFLLSLPGITVHNYRAVMNQVENIAELSKLDVQRLSPIIGSSSATKLVEFFKQKITI